MQAKAIIAMRLFVDILWNASFSIKKFFMVGRWVVVEMLEMVLLLKFWQPLF